MAHETSSEIFSKSLNEISRRIFELIHSSAAHDRLGAVLAIRNIVGCELEELFSSLPRYANYLRVLIPSKDTVLMREACKCLGLIFKKGGSAVGEIVDFELNRVCQWLGDKSEANQMAACLLLECILENYDVSAACIPKIYASVWGVLRDTRSAALQESCSGVLKILLKRLSAYGEANGTAFLGAILGSAVAELSQPSSSTSLQGTLVLLNDLLPYAHDLLEEAKGSLLLDMLLRMASNKTAAVRFLSLEIVPELALYLPDLFVGKYLGSWMGLLLECLRKDRDRSQALRALSMTAKALGPHVAPFLASLGPTLHALLLAGKSQQDEGLALTAIGDLAEACSESFQDTAKLLLPLFLARELDEPLLAALAQCLRQVPDLIVLFAGKPWGPCGG